jgi:Protein of unknown function (DUF3800)
MTSGLGLKDGGRYSWSMPVADLARALCLPQAGGVLGMFAAYFDESYSDKAPRILVVAGYMAPIEQWGRFEAEWREFLQKFEVSNPFHMTDFMAGRGQFSGWSQKKQDECIYDYISLIRRRTHLRLSVGFDLSVYETAMADFKEQIGPYAFCVFEWMQEAERFMDKYQIVGPIAYVFESGSGFGGQIFDTMVWVKRRRQLRERYRLGSFTFADKRQVLPLQAADIFAWESRAHHARYVQSSPMRRSTWLLASRCRHQALFFGSVAFDSWKKRFNEYAALHPDPEEGL